jgi:hypothetical protein
MASSAGVRGMSAFTIVFIGFRNLSGSSIGTNLSSLGFGVLNPWEVPHNGKLQAIKFNKNSRLTTKDVGPDIP